MPLGSPPAHLPRSGQGQEDDASGDIGTAAGAFGTGTATTTGTFEAKEPDTMVKATGTTDSSGNAPTDHDPRTPSRRAFPAIVQGGLLPAVVTAVLFVPEFFRDPADAGDAPGLTLAWAGFLLLGAPTAASVMNRRMPVATDLLRGSPRCARLVSRSALMPRS